MKHSFLELSLLASLATVRRSGSDSALRDHALSFITIHAPLSAGETAFRGYGQAKRASAWIAAAISRVAAIALAFITFISSIRRSAFQTELRIFPARDLAKT